VKTGIHTSPNQRETNQPVTRALHARPGPTNSLADSLQTISLDDEQPQRMPEEATYFVAEDGEFCEDSELDDWLAAKAEVDSKLESSNA
jgi:hypothetical protein